MSFEMLPLETQAEFTQKLKEFEQCPDDKKFLFDNFWLLIAEQILWKET